MALALFINILLLTLLRSTAINGAFRLNHPGLVVAGRAVEHENNQ